MTRPIDRPQPTRVYQNHHLDSTRWEGFTPRPGDIIVTTAYKAGTTFTQQILLHLLHGKEDPLPELSELSPWVDARFLPVEIGDLLTGLEAQPGRRFVKSHLPLDGLPFFEEVTYLVVGRDPRDVFMSFANHYENYSEFAFESVNGGDFVGDPLPAFPEDIQHLWRDWITRGWFEWESEGYPFWSNLHHTQTYWNYRHLPNLRFLHYADLLADLPGTVRRIADWIGCEVSDGDVARVVEATTFANVKEKAIEADVNAPEDEPRFFKGGRSTFIFKGTNGRWKGVLTEQELAQYDEAKARVLSPDCARWLETGGPVPR